LREEDLIKAILERNKNLDSETIEKLVEEKLRSSPFLNRLGALLIILEEMRISSDFLQKTENFRDEFIKISSLTSGLSKVNLVGRVLGVRFFASSDGEKAVKLRLWDGSASVDVFVWEGVEELQDIRVGDAVAVWNCYTSSKPSRGIVVNAGQKAKVEKLQDPKDLPDISAEHFKIPQDISALQDVDFSAVIVVNGGLRKFGGRKLCELLVSDGEREVSLTAYEEAADFFSNLKHGDRFLASSAILRNGELSATSRTFLTRMFYDMQTTGKALERSLGRLHVLNVGVCVDGVRAVTDGKSLMRVISPNTDINSGCMFVENSFVLKRKGIPHLYSTSIEPTINDCNINIPMYSEPLENLPETPYEGLFTMTLTRKTILTVYETKFGEREMVGFWVSYRDKAYAGTAWGEAAQILDKIAEGSKITVGFPKIRRNKYGEVEVNFDSKSIISAGGKLS